jgi:uncharacterized oligopeptide transporter (OPT) family protein
MPCPPAHEAACSSAANVGVVLAVIEDPVPKHLKKYTLSSTTAGIAFVIPAWNTISMLIGGFLGWVFAKLHAQKAKRYSRAIAAAFIAGESHVAVLVAALMAANLLQAG